MGGRGRKTTPDSDTVATSVPVSDLPIGEHSLIYKARSPVHITLSKCNHLTNPALLLPQGLAKSPAQGDVVTMCLSGAPKQGLLSSCPGPQCLLQPAPCRGAGKASAVQAARRPVCARRCMSSRTPGVQMCRAQKSHWRSRSRAGVVAEEEAWGEPCSWHADAVSAQGQDHLEQVQGRERAGGPGTGGSQGEATLSETALGCHWSRPLGAVTFPGARTGHCQAKRRQHTACPW